MKIFISWSGTSSRLVAEALSDWLQRVIQAIKPFYSHDIDKGAKWSNEVDDALEGTRFGIICLTPDNLESTWIHYEAGALSKTKDASIWTFLLELKPSDVKQPLGRFQHTLAEKADVLKMLKSINTKLFEINGESLRENLLEEIFEESWTKLEMRLNKAKEAIIIQSEDGNNKSIERGRNDDDKLNEILEILRSQQRKPSNEERFKIASIKLDDGNEEDNSIIQGAILYFTSDDSEKFASNARAFIKGYLGSKFKSSTIVAHENGHYLEIQFTSGIEKNWFKRAVPRLKESFLLDDFILIPSN